MFDGLRTLNRSLRVAAVVGGLAVPAFAAATDDDFIAAMRLYHDDRYTSAFGKLATLADSGHQESARIALLMLRHGPGLYRSQWSATREQVQLWLQLATQRQSVVVAEGSD